MKKIAALLVVMFSVVVAASFAISADKGPESIEIKTIQEKKPPVQFDHKAHQDMVGDCKVCHHTVEADQTPKACSECHKKEATGDTPEFKKAMHNSCKDCHKKEKAAGKNPPTKCKECHKE